MKVILTEDVRKLGKKGDVVEVSDGYARNYLFGRKLAIEATSQSLKELGDRAAANQRRDEKQKAHALELKAKLSGKVIHIALSSGEGGRLFGSVTAAQIAACLEGQYGATVDKKLIKLESTVKSLGAYPVTLKLYPGVEATMTLSVEAQ